MNFPRTLIPSTDTSPWILLFVPFYGLGLRPALFYFWPALRPWSDWVLLAVMVIFLASYYFSQNKIYPGKALSLTQAGPHLFLGLSAGALVILSPLFLDWLIDSTHLTKQPLFIGAQVRPLEQPPFSQLEGFKLAILRPALGQIILVGFFMQPLAGRTRQINFILLTALLFPVFFWQFSLGMAILGAVSAWMFRFTGTLYAGMSFQALCGYSVILVLYVAPRTLTLFGILF